MEMEEVIHDYDKICSMTVIEAELLLLGKMMKATSSADEKGLFKTKIENIEYQKSTIETNCQCGILTADQYLADMKKYLAD
jgi:hypothetical protein